MDFGLVNLGRACLSFLEGQGCLPALAAFCLSSFMEYCWTLWDSFACAGHPLQDQAEELLNALQPLNPAAATPAACPCPAKGSAPPLPMLAPSAGH